MDSFRLWLYFSAYELTTLKIMPGLNITLIKKIKSPYKMHASGISKPSWHQFLKTFSRDLVTECLAYENLGSRVDNYPHM
jgi:hypothetical protein